MPRFPKKQAQIAALAEQATGEKSESFEELINAMKDDLRYAENTVGFDDDTLSRCKWQEPLMDADKRKNLLCAISDQQ